MYSPEVLRAFGQALINLLKNLAMYLRAMEALSVQHDTSEWLPRLIFLLLQNPLNGQQLALTKFQRSASCEFSAYLLASDDPKAFPDLLRPWQNAAYRGKVLADGV